MEDQRPSVGVAHAVLETDRMEDSGRFMARLACAPYLRARMLLVYEVTRPRRAIRPGATPYEKEPDNDIRRWIRDPRTEEQDRRLQEAGNVGQEGLAEARRSPVLRVRRRRPRDHARL